MDSMEDLKGRIRAHPASSGGPPDEGYWLDLLEFTLAEMAPEGLDPIAALTAKMLERHPEKWRAYIAASEKDLLAYKTVGALFSSLRRRGPLEEPVQEWAYDVAEGLRPAPKDGSDKRKQALRNAVILAAVNGIHDVSGLPYDFDEPKSGEPRTACHAVAERLGMPFTTVRTIWRNRKQDGFWDRARKLGVVPPPRPRQRRRPQTP